MSDSSLKMFQASPVIGKIPDGRRLAWYFLEPLDDICPMFPSSLPDSAWCINIDFIALVPSWMILI